MRKGPFGLPETATDRFLREERERAELRRSMLGGGTIAEAIRQATSHQRLLQSLDFDAPYRSLMAALEGDRKQRETLKELASTAWALSVTETARGIVERHADLVNDQRRLSSSVVETVRAFDANQSVVGAAIAAASAGDSFRRLITDALPRMSMFGAIAERMLMVDMATLRASESAAQSTTALAAEMVLEAQRISEAIADSATDEESARLYGSLLELLLEFLTNLGPNTIPELQRMGLIGFITLVITLLSAYALIPRQPAQSPQDQAAFEQLNDKFDRLQEEARRYYEAEAQVEQRYLANLPRAELRRDATFRRKPARNGEVVLNAPKGMEVAIAKTQARWRLVVFRDPLSNQLAQAWVYATAVAPLAAPP